MFVCLFVFTLSFSIFFLLSSVSPVLTLLPVLFSALVDSLFLGLFVIFPVYYFSAALNHLSIKSPPPPAFGSLLELLQTFDSCENQRQIIW